MNRKPVCLHFHLYKNAGATVEGALRRCFGRSFRRLEGPTAESEVDASSLAGFLEKHSGVSAVSGHQFRFPLPDSPGWEILSILFLRHPLDRVFSVYYYERDDCGNSKGRFMARQRDLRGYVDWRMNSREFRMIGNFQTAALAHGLQGAPRQRLGQAALDRAMRRVRRCAVLGIVERFDESMILAEHILGAYFPGIDLSYTKKNVRPGRPESLSRRLEEGRRALGEDGFREIMKANQMDFELYAFACEELDRRLGCLGDYSRRLKDFRQRCVRRKRRALG